MSDAPLHPRQKRHREIRALMESGDLEAALFEFKLLIQEQGPHVGLLCDLAGCYYELAQYRECWRTLQYLENELLACEHKLSRTSAWRTYLMLAKFQEEQAEPAQALASLQKAIGYCDSPEDKKWILLQNLRIQSYFGKRKDLTGKYLEVIEKVRADQDLKIESLHTLLWTDWILFGFAAAEIRWNQVSSLQLNILDQRLMARDFIEIACLAESSMAESLNPAKDLLESATPLDYDRALLKACAGEFIGDDLETNLSEMMRLRLLLVCLKTEKSTAKKEQLRKKFLFYINDLSRESKELFRALLPNSDGQTVKILTVNTQDKSLQIDESSEILKLTPLQVKFLAACTAETNALDTLAKAIWDTGDDESIYHRLRMVVYKLNETLTLRMGFTPFEIKKEGVMLNPLLKIALRPR